MSNQASLKLQFDKYGEFLPVRGTVAELRLYPTLTLQSGDMIKTSGQNDPLDGLGADWAWNPTSQADDDGASVVQPGNLPAGRWTRIVNSLGIVANGLGTATNLAPSQAAVKSKFDQSITAKDYGAKGNKVVDDSQAILTTAVAARDTPQPAGTSVRTQTYQEGLVLPPGSYTAGDIQMNIYTAANVSGTSKLIIRAAVPGTVTILIPDGKYFMEVGGRYESVDIDGIRFRGGLGAFKFTHTGNNVNRIVSFNKCEFFEYTQCAIGNLAEDAPYLRVRDCYFSGNGGGSIGVAWGGYADLAIIEGCVFDRNNYHIKIGDRISGNVNILRNDFIKNASDYYRNADIWLVPNKETYNYGASSGHNTTIAYNKFGNENLIAGERRILIADEDPATGADRLSRYHSTATSGNYTSGVVIHNNFFGSKYLTGTQLPDGNDAPIIGVYTPQTRAFHIYNNQTISGRYQWFVYFYNPVGGYDYYTNNQWNIELDATNTFQYGVINAPVALITDPFGVGSGDPKALSPVNAQNDTPVLKYNGNATRPTVAGGTTVVNTADRYGGTNMVTATFPDGGILYGDVANLGYAGEQHWIQIELGKVATAARQCQFLTLDIRNYATGQTAIIMPITTKNGVAGPFYFYLPATPNNTDFAWQWRLYPTYGVKTPNTADQVIAGRCFIGVGNQIANVGHLATTGSGFNTPHMTMGAFHLWVDAQSRLRLKGDGAPTADLQGKVMPQGVANQVDSTAADVATLKTDLNSLLAKLRSAGLLI